MELQHQFTVPAPVGTTWDTFMDLAGVAACFPGATVTSVEGDRFEGTCKVKLGPIALLYAGSGQFVTRDDDAHRATIEASGKDKRGNGTAGAKVTIALDRRHGRAGEARGHPGEIHERVPRRPHRGRHGELVPQLHGLRLPPPRGRRGGSARWRGACGRHYRR